MAFVDAQHYRQSLEEELKFHREAGNADIVMGLEIAVADLVDEPTTIPDTWPRGRWLDLDCFDAHKQPCYMCSNCRNEVADNYIKQHKYCLHCGAKMEE